MDRKLAQAIAVSSLIVGTVTATIASASQPTSKTSPVTLAQTENRQPSIPQIISSCETSGYGKFCGTWVWNGKYFEASWDNGAKAKLMLEQFDKNSVVLTRQDDSGPSIGLTARYEGHPNGNQIKDGTVTGRWHWNTGRIHTQTWSWTANW